MCEHTETVEGPRTPLLYGTSATEVCKQCGMWRMIFRGNCPWTKPPIPENDPEDDERY
jgi:hypothetical protein